MVSKYCSFIDAANKGTGANFQDFEANVEYGGNGSCDCL